MLIWGRVCFCGFVGPYLWHAGEPTGPSAWTLRGLWRLRGPAGQGVGGDAAGSPGLDLFFSPVFCCLFVVFVCVFVFLFFVLSFIFWLTVAYDFLVSAVFVSSASFVCFQPFRCFAACCFVLVSALLVSIAHFLYCSCVLLSWRNPSEEAMGSLYLALFFPFSVSF